jgi:hypothetical protein
MMQGNQRLPIDDEVRDILFNLHSQTMTNAIYMMTSNFVPLEYASNW